MHFENASIKLFFWCTSVMCNKDKTNWVDLKLLFVLVLDLVLGFVLVLVLELVFNLVLFLLFLPFSSFFHSQWQTERLIKQKPQQLIQVRHPRWTIHCESVRSKISVVCVIFIKTRKTQQRNEHLWPNRKEWMKEWQKNNWHDARIFFIARWRK